MPHVLITLPFVKDDDLVSWKLVKHLEEAPESIHIPGPFKRGDLFGIVSAEYVSDIDDHLWWVGVAVSGKKILPVSIPNTKISNFIAVYRHGGVLDLFSILPDSTDDKIFVEIALQCVEQALRGDLHEHYLKREIHVLREFMRGREDAHSVEAIYTSNVAAYDEDRSRNALEGTLANLCKPLIYDVDVYGALEDAFYAFSLYIRDDVFSKTEITFRKLVPLLTLFLSYAENKPLTLKTKSKYSR